MYDLNLFDEEKIELISDNTLVYTDDGDKICSSIVTNIRYLILDYPGMVHNSLEDLRTSGKMNYIRKKEVIFSIEINDIVHIGKDSDYDKITFKNNQYVLINDKEIIEYLKNKI